MAKKSVAVAKLKRRPDAVAAKARYELARMKQAHLASLLLLWHSGRLSDIKNLVLNWDLRKEKTARGLQWVMDPVEFKTKWRAVDADDPGKILHKKVAEALSEHNVTFRDEIHGEGYREGGESGSLREKSPGPVSKLVGVAEDDFLKQKFGAHWLHAKASELRLPFTVEDCLSLVSEFDADLHEEARSKRKRSYGEHRAVLDDVSQRVAFGATATQIWSGSSVNFWSVAICRTLAGSLERLEDHKYVAQILREQPLRSSEDLALHGRNWTFIFNKAHAATAELHSLHHALWACFGVSGDFNVYLTPPDSQGLAPHADRHDVFVAQQQGEKTWTLLEPDKVRVMENVTLLPGDVLYLPQGVPHYARSAGQESSLHVTMSVYRGHFTFAGLLAAWLEVQDSDPPELFDLSLANRIDATQTRLTEQGLEEANEPLPPSFWPMLRALDDKDFPNGAAEAAVAEAQLLAAQLAGRLRRKSEVDDASLVGRLEVLGERVDDQRLRSFLEALPTKGSLPLASSGGSSTIGSMGQKSSKGLKCRFCRPMPSFGARRMQLR
ncbi:unnamed protein product [Symbiodinium sp. CCMP2592]|nr:unnamed protein product [Symbiodinium sp. CCMP2592]